MLSTSRPMVLPSNCSAQMSSGTAGVPGSSPQPRHPASLLQAQVVLPRGVPGEPDKATWLVQAHLTGLADDPGACTRKAKCCQHHALWGCLATAPHRCQVALEVCQEAAHNLGTLPLCCRPNWWYARRTRRA